MKLMIASDLHGSATWCARMVAAFDVERPDWLVLLGDLLYHGPRNALPDGYDPKGVIAQLNPLADHILAVRGNCDAEVDQMVLDFPMMADYAVIVDAARGRSLYCTHGHVQTPQAHPRLPRGTVFLSGHTHVKTCGELPDGSSVVAFNPGSVSLPKDGSHSYGVYEDGALRHVVLA
ncbi:phosphodiesterase [bacterium]|nr:phosphodiesterase [bacterium]